MATNRARQKVRDLSEYCRKQKEHTQNPEDMECTLKKGLGPCSAGVQMRAGRGESLKFLMQTDQASWSSCLGVKAFILVGVLGLAASLFHDSNCYLMSLLFGLKDFCWHSF